MGKTKLEPQQSNTTITHFSHPHTLELITHQNFAPSNLCSGCKIEANGSVYTCKSCNFFLHVQCSQMPQQINHPFDKQHALSLLPKPIYPEGNFRCDACGETGDGFSYHCNSCGIDLHILCAVLPQYIAHRSHRHQLEIQFSSPYPSKSFRCDICKHIGTNQWLYRCHTCGFDAHLNCTKLQSHFHQNPITSTNSRSAPQQYQHHCAGVDHMNQEIKNEISSLETLRKQREDEDKLMAEMIMGGVNHETQRLNQLLGRTNPGNNNGTTAAAAPQFGASQSNEMSFPEILRKQREDQDKMMAEMISGATYRQNQQLSHMIAASSLNNQAINHQSGVLHSDVSGVSEAWHSWLMTHFQSIIQAPTVESIPEWAACIRYAVTGKGKHGTKIPLLRQKVMDCLMNPLPETVSTTVVAKRYMFLSAALIEVSPPKMPVTELALHYKLLEELLGSMSHSSPQVRESIGVTLSVLCSNIRLQVSCNQAHPHEVGTSNVNRKVEAGNWDHYLVERASELVVKIQSFSQSDTLDVQTDMISDNGVLTEQSHDDVKWMETLFHFIISSLKSGRSSVLLDVVVGLLYPVISLQETSNKDLSTLAKIAFELLKWRVYSESHLRKVVLTILSIANDTNWRTRSTTLTYLRSFMYRHTFVLSKVDKQQIWQTVEKLLADNQVEVREHAAAVLAGLMKGGDEDLAQDFRHRAYTEANIIQKKRKQRSMRSGFSVASLHGKILALAACVLSVPYDIPSWLPEHVTLLAQFVSESSPVKSTVTKAVAEFRRTHADTWNVQKDSFTEEQLEVLADTSSSSSYFA